MTKSKGVLIRDPIARFWANTVVTEGCWNWIGTKDSSGYGQQRANGPLVLIHRFAYTLLRGPIDDGLEIDHLCRNRLCVNPDHLEVVTHKVNTTRALGKTICKNGHLRIPENLTVNKSCKVCMREAYHRSKLP